MVGTTIGVVFASSCVFLPLSTQAFAAGSTTSATLNPSTLNDGYAGPMTIGITGTGFIQGLSIVTVDNSSGTNMASNFQVQSATSMTFSLAGGLSSGNYTVSVNTENTIEQGTLTVSTPNVTANPSSIQAGYSSGQTITLSVTGMTVTGSNPVTLSNSSSQDMSSSIQSESVSGSLITLTLNSGLSTGSYTFTIDGVATVPFTVAPAPLSITSTTLPSAVEGQSFYSATLQASGSSSNVTWSSTNLPNWLTISGSTIELASGASVPSAAKTYQFPITATVQGQTPVTAQVALQVTSSGQITQASSSTGIKATNMTYVTGISGTTVNVAYNTTATEFLNAIASTDGSTQAYALTDSSSSAVSGSTALVSGDILTVTAADGSTKATYSITAAKDSSTGIKATNTTYVTGISGTTVNVAYNTTATEFLNAIASTDGSTQAYALTDSSSSAVSGSTALVSGDVLTVTAADGSTKATYSITAATGSNTSSNTGSNTGGGGNESTSKGSSNSGSTSVTPVIPPAVVTTKTTPGQSATAAVTGNDGTIIQTVVPADDVNQPLQVQLHALTTIPFTVTALPKVIQALQLSAQSSAGSAVSYFSHPITVTLTLSAAPTTPVAVVFWNPLTGNWQPITAVNINQNKITFSTSHFTTFAVVPNSAIQDISRIAGTTREDTTIQAAESAYPDGANAVVLASAGSKLPSPDALSASGLAGALHAPLLLTPSQQIDPADLQAIQALGAKTVYVVGGKFAVSDAVVNALQNAGLTVIRDFAGKTLYDTSLLIDQYLYQQKLSNASTVFIANGQTMIDALSASPVVYQNGAPMLLVKTGQKALTSEQLAFLQSAGIKQAVLLGGTYVVSSGIENQLGQTLGVGSVQRLGGKTMNDTAIAIDEHYFPNPTGAVVSANGTPTGIFVDALSASAFAANNNIPVVLTNRNGLPNSTRQYLGDQKNLRVMWVMGGDSAVVPSVDQALSNDIASPTP